MSRAHLRRRSPRIFGFDIITVWINIARAVKMTSFAIIYNDRYQSKSNQSPYILDSIAVVLKNQRSNTHTIFETEDSYLLIHILDECGFLI
jgi:hypothetical protein